MGTILDSIDTLITDTWVWFNGLSQDEWMVVLASVAGLGFLCMRGFKGRGTI